MKNIYIKYYFLIVFALCSVISIAQVNTLYYMNTVSTRHELNPAFQPAPGGYLGLPVISSMYLGVGNNSLTLNDILYPKDGQLYGFYNNSGKISDLLGNLKENTRLYGETNISLLSFGFRIKSSYITFGATQKLALNTYLPKSLFNIFEGTHDPAANNLFNMDRLSLNATSYTEYALGYSQVINERLSVGAKAKLLLGQANVSVGKNSTIRLNASRDLWSLDMNSEINATLPKGVNLSLDGNKIDDINTDGFEPLDLLKPAGTGFAVDLGATYKLLDNRLALSASVLDLGLIKWKGTNKINAKGSSTFEGLEHDLDDQGNILDKDYADFFEAMADSFKYEAFQEKYSYSTALASKILLGAEYAVVKEKLTVGVLWKSTLINKSLFNEITTSANYLPADWFNASVSYSWINGRFSTIGLGLGGRLGPFNLYVAGDYIPFHYASNVPVPYKTQSINVQAGLILNFAYSKFVDDDNDGVKNKKDKCPYTPVGYWVDKYGCPIDSDGDGVADNVDKCPDTPAGVPVDEFGCPFDSDGDGVLDYLDKCPNTPAGAVVDETGCPIDSDGDGVPDYLDKCPGTPVEAYGFIDENGCPIDSDGDSVPDYLDKCPGTPVEAYGFIDENGCPKDTDGDGVLDYLDKCPTVKGTPENNGCPVVKEAVKKVFEKALQGIQFETGKDAIKKSSFPILDQIVTIMKENPEYLLLINGHTDNVGKPESNQILSEKRANSVQNYLIKGGIDPLRLTAKGYGDTQPVVENTTKANKAKNRRVEFIVKFEKFEQE